MPTLPPEWQAFFDNLNNAAGVITITLAISTMLWYIVLIFAGVVFVRWLLYVWRWLSVQEAKAQFAEAGGTEALERQTKKWIVKEGERLPTGEEYMARLIKRRKYRWDILLVAVYLFVLAAFILPVLFIAQQPAMATVGLVIAVLILAILLVSAAL
jgi:hypothetical protein